MIKTLLNFILIVLIFVSTVGYTLNRLQDPEFIITQAREVNVYGRVTNFLPTLFPATEIPGLPLSQADQILIITSAINGETFYDFLNKYLTFHLGWFKGEIKEYQFEYNFIQAKARAETKTTEILLTRYNQLPLCRANQLRGWDASTTFPECKLSNEIVTVDSDIGKMFASLSKNFINATDSAGKEIFPSVMVLDSPSNNLIQARQFITTTNKIVNAIWLITAIFLALYLVILRRRAFFPLAFIFIVVGLLQIGFSYIAWDWLARALVDFFADSDLKEMLALIAEVVATSLEFLKTIMGSLSIISLTTGAISLLIGIILNFRKPKVISL